MTSTQYNVGIDESGTNSTRFGTPVMWEFVGFDGFQMMVSTSFSNAINLGPFYLLGQLHYRAICSSMKLFIVPEENYWVADPQKGWRKHVYVKCLAKKNKEAILSGESKHA